VKKKKTLFNISYESMHLHHIYVHEAQ